VTATAAAGNPAGDCTYTASGNWGGQNNVLHLANSEATDIALACPGLLADYVTENKYRWDVKIVYYNDNTDATYSKTSVGELLTTIES
jgi:hypothetical protein